jgi:hypothetical protein
MPVMFRDYFKADLWMLFAELSYFYRQICAKQVSKGIMPLHLPWEASAFIFSSFIFLNFTSSIM